MAFDTIPDSMIRMTCLSLFAEEMLKVSGIREFKLSLEDLIALVNFERGSLESKESAKTETALEVRTLI
jgi:hypothetical protein